MTVLPKAIYRFKLSMAFFAQLEQKFYNLFGNMKDLK